MGWHNVSIVRPKRSDCGLTKKLTYRRPGRVSRVAELRRPTAVRSGALLDANNQQPKRKMNITKITIGRLYNLGSYEHVRYELTAEVPEGESAAEAVTGMEKILAGLAPTKNAGIQTAAEIAHKTKEIQDMRTMPVVDWQRRYGHCTGSAAEVIARYEASLQEEIEKREKVLARAKRARELFDDLGGAAKWKDAKLDWDNGDDDY